MATIPEEIRELVERLSLNKQRRVLEFAQELSQTDQDSVSLAISPLPPGTPGPVLLRALQRFKLPLEEVEAMEHAIEEGCERVDPDEHLLSAGLKCADTLVEKRPNSS